MNAPASKPALDRDEIEAFLTREFPQIGVGEVFAIEAAGPMSARLRMIYQPGHLRPGGTISGPAMFMLADVALYAAILAQIGPVKLAVTTNMTINFLSKPAPRDLIGEARLFKVGKRLAVGEVAIWSQGEEDRLCAHATGSYSIPPRGDAQ